MNDEIKSWVSKERDLDYLRPILKRTLEHCVECRNAIKSDSNVLLKTLPTAGRELSLTPLLLASCYENNHLASMEVNIERKHSYNQGKLDLIIYSKSKSINSDGDLIEIKALRKNTYHKEFNEKIKLKMKQAERQLKSINMTNFKKVSNFGRLGIVIVQLTVTEANKESSISLPDLSTIESNFSKLKKDFDALA